MIFSAGIVDLTFIALEAVRPRPRPARRGAGAASQSGGLSTGRLALWVVGWGVALVLVATLLLGQPIGYVLFAIVLVFLFVFINGISQGISDWNPISSAFVVSVLLMSAIGLRDPIVAMMAASVLLVSTHRRRRHAAGPIDRLAAGIEARDPVPLSGRRHRDGRGAVRGAGRVLHERVPGAASIDMFTPPGGEGRHLAVGDDLQVRGRDPRHRPPGVATRSRRSRSAWRSASSSRSRGAGSRRRAATSASSSRARAGSRSGWIVDAILLASPYASSTGGFLDLEVGLWFAGGSVVSSLLAWQASARAKQPEVARSWRRPARRHEHHVARRRRPDRGRVAVRARRRHRQPARRRHRQAPRQALTTCDWSLLAIPGTAVTD